MVRGPTCSEQHASVTRAISPSSSTTREQAQKFYVMRGELKTELEALPHFGSDSRYANVHLVNDDAVQALLKIAQREKK